jgi:hypothetical protein
VPGDPGIAVRTVSMDHRHMRSSDFSGSFDQPPEISQPREIETDGIREAELAKEKEALETVAPDKGTGERAGKENAERAERTEEAADRRLREAAVKRDFDSGLQERVARADQIIETLVERAGADRGGSLAEISQEISALDRLLAEQAEATRRASGPLLDKDAADQIASFHADAEDLAGDLRHLERVLLREERIEEAHIQRVPGLIDLDLTAMDRTVITNVARAVAVVVAQHVVTGHGDLLAGISEWVTKACDTPEQLDSARGLKVTAPLPIGGLLVFDVETTLSDDIGADEESPLALGTGLNLDGAPASYLQVELVEERVPANNAPDQSGEPADPEDAGQAESQTGRHARPADEPERPAVPRRVSVRAGLGWPATLAGPDPGLSAGPPGEAEPSYELAAWLQDTPQASAPALEEAIGGETAGPRTQRPDLPLGAGIVIWGSARAVALRARTRMISADILLSCGREAAFEQVYDGTPESVAHAMRVARGLEAVVFLDPGIQGGAWIDIDPVTQAPAASFLIDMPVSSGVVQGFRLLRS